MNNRLPPDQQTVVVTGAGGGMGHATVQTLIARGWHVLAIDRDGASLSSLNDRLGSKLSVLATDIRENTLASHVVAALEDLPTLGGLVNLAGISAGGGLESVTDAEWDLAFATNVTPAFRLTQALAARLCAHGCASVVNVGSPVGVVGARKPQYAASKAALHGLTMSCARALGPSGVRVNLLLPGPTITGMTTDWSPEQRTQVAQGTFLKRLCLPEEVALVIAFLIGADSRYITASVVDMTAGSMLGH
jgi:NAD(P)-dependent dehydrogenase (short-subunit alcohol dehydrogenase family)